MIIKHQFRLVFALLLIATLAHAQPPSPSQIQARLPKGTVIHGNIPYNNDTLKKHLLDIYLPAEEIGRASCRERV